MGSEYRSEDRSERIPPHDAAAEQAVLGALLKPGEFDRAWSAVEDSGIRAEDFFSPRHQEIFRRISFASWQPGGADPTILAGQLREKQTAADQQDPLEYLGTLITGYHYAANVPLYASRVKEMAIRRQALRRAAELAKAVYQANGEHEISEILAGHLEDLRVLQDEGRTEQGLETEGVDDFLAHDFGDQLLLVGHDVFLVGTWMHIQGEPKSGKSLLLLDLAFELARDQDQNPKWCGFNVFGPKRVLYLCAEGGERALQKRVEARKEGLNQAERDRVHVWYPTQRLLRALSDPADYKRLRNTIIEKGFDVIILDPLRKFAVGLDENKTCDAVQITAALIELKQSTGCSIVTAHHTRKSTITTRKGSALEGAGSHEIPGSADTVLDFSIDGEQGAPERKMTFTMRHGETPEPRLVKFEQATRKFEVITTKMGRRPKYDFDDVIDYLGVSGVMEEKQIRAELSVGRDWLNRALKDAKAEGVVRATGAGTSGDPRRWGLPHQISDEEADFS